MNLNIKRAKIRILALDLKGCIYLNHFSHSQRICYFFRGVSRMGDGPFWYAMLATAWWVRGWQFKTSILYVLLGTLVGTAIYKILKTKTIRPRPYQVHQVIHLGERPLDHFSFPSGHTLHAVLATIVIGYIEPLLLLLMLPFTFLVALSRMILGLHYPSDVLVGAIIGAVVGCCIILCAPYFAVLL